MPANRQPNQMDNPYYDWSPINQRPPLRWPDNARVAFCVIVNLEQIEWLPPKDALVPPSVVRYGPYPDIFDPHELSHHEYGNRVGFFRIAQVLDRHHVRATSAIDGALALSKPFLVQQCLDRNWEVIGHGLSFGRIVSELMSEQQERAYLERSLKILEQSTGTRPNGWHGPDYGESTRTVGILAELGIRYVCDWPNDEQPYRMKVPSGEMVSLPIALELDDIYTQRERGLSVQQWTTMVTQSFDRLYADGETSGRLLVLNLHPYLTGQPFRTKYLEQVISHITGHERVWHACGSEIVDWYLGNNTRESQSDS